MRSNATCLVAFRGEIAGLRNQIPEFTMLSVCEHLLVWFRAHSFSSTPCSNHACINIIALCTVFSSTRQQLALHRTVNTENLFKSRLPQRFLPILCLPVPFSGRVALWPRFLVVVETLRLRTGRRPDLWTCKEISHLYQTSSVVGALRCRLLACTWHVAIISIIQQS